MAVLGIQVTALALGDVLVVVAIGAVLFVVVCVVAAVLMALLQSVLPRVDTEAEAVHQRELEAEGVGRPLAADTAALAPDEEEPELG